MEDARVFGCVKFFDKKKGFGMITVIHPTDPQYEVFAHFSALVVDKEQYKYLEEGEYVECQINKVVKNGEDKLNAVKITGIYGGPLKCQTNFIRIQTQNNLKNGRRNISGGVGGGVGGGEVGVMDE